MTLFDDSTHHEISLDLKYKVNGGWKTFICCKKNEELSYDKWIQIVDMVPIELYEVPKKYQTVELILLHKLKWK